MSIRPVTSERIPETFNGQQGLFIADKYNEMQRHIRDNGWLSEKVELILRQGICTDHVLELGMGPGYLGLEWLQHPSTRGRLTGVDISAEMVTMARQNSEEYGLSDLTTYVLGDALELPFDNDTFDAVFSYGSLHEWNDASQVFREIARVLIPGGRFLVMDLRRDLDREAIQFMKSNIDALLRKGFLCSVRSSFTCDEIHDLVKDSGLTNIEISSIPLGLYVFGNKSNG